MKSPTMADVNGLWSDLKGVTSSAMDYLRAKPVDTKRIPLFQCIPIVFPLNNTSMPQKREATWVNPAGDAFFTEVGHETFIEYTEPGGGNVHTTSRLVDTEIGLVLAEEEAGSLAFPAIFDFEWNFKYGRNGAQYGVESALGGTDGYCSRKSLGNKVRGQMLNWDPADPLVLLAGDPITWTILPTLVHIEPDSAFLKTLNAITVNVYLTGFRTGTAAEADYELR